MEDPNSSITQAYPDYVVYFLMIGFVLFALYLIAIIYYYFQILKKY